MSPFRTRHDPRSAIRLAFIVLAISAVWRSAAAQQPAGAEVRGTVMDSLTNAPLAGAVLQLVSRDEPVALGVMATSDSLGRYAFQGIAPGRYWVGVYHPTLRELGFNATVRGVTVDQRRSVRVDLATPGPTQVHTALCGAPPAGAGAGILVGMIRGAADGGAVAGATVTAEWLDLSLTGRRLERQLDGRTAETNANGWYALCDVPSPGTVAVRASHGADGTDAIRAELPAGGFLRMDLFVGRATARGAAAGGDQEAGPRTGGGRVHGVVLDRAGNAVADAFVRIVNGPEVRSGAGGVWSLEGAPTGTRLLEAGAEGYRTALRAVDVTADDVPIRITLLEPVIALDPIRVAAARVVAEGFEERSRSLGGRLITRADMERRAVFNVSDVLATVPGLYVERTTRGTGLYMRSIFGIFEDRCIPAVVLNGHILRNLLADDLDAMVSPHEVTAIEIYTESQVPPQFQVGLSGCGSVVVWTR